MLKSNRGFTLIEIMVVISVILIILALSLPSMLRSRMNSNEIAAIGNCRTVSNACQSYYTNVIPHVYPANLAALTGATPAYIDSTFAGAGQRQGYIFTYVRLSTESFQLRARPATPGRTGVRYFFVDETGVIRANATGPAGPGDPPISG